jgi:hypothetical protein
VQVPDVCVPVRACGRALASVSRVPFQNVVSDGGNPNCATAATTHKVKRREKERD